MFTAWRVSSVYGFGFVGCSVPQTAMFDALTEAQLLQLSADDLFAMGVSRLAQVCPVSMCIKSWADVDDTSTADKHGTDSYRWLLHWPLH